MIWGSFIQLLIHWKSYTRTSQTCVNINHFPGLTGVSCTSESKTSQRKILNINGSNVGQCEPTAGWIYAQDEDGRSCESQRQNR